MIFGALQILARTLRRASTRLRALILATSDKTSWKARRGPQGRRWRLNICAVRPTSNSLPAGRHIKSGQYLVLLAQLQASSLKPRASSFKLQLGPADFARLQRARSAWALCSAATFDRHLRLVAEPGPLQPGSAPSQVVARLRRGDGALLRNWRAGQKRSNDNR